MDKHKIKKLTTHDLAFDMGRKATDEELEELLSRPCGNGKDKTLFAQDSVSGKPQK
jgi:hypothetical protein